MKLLSILPKAKGDALATHSQSSSLVVTNSGTVMVDASSAARLLRRNGTFKAIEKYMKPLYRKKP